MRRGTESYSGHRWNVLRINGRNIELQLYVTPVEESIEAYDSVLGTLPDSALCRPTVNILHVRFTVRQNWDCRECLAHEKLNAAETKLSRYGDKPEEQKLYEEDFLVVSDG